MSAGKVIYDFAEAQRARQMQQQEQHHVDGERVKQQVRDALITAERVRLAEERGHDEGRNQERERWRERAGHWLFWGFCGVLGAMAIAFAGGYAMARSLWP